MPLSSLNYSTSIEPVWIRKATVADVPDVFRIETRSFKDPYSPVMLFNLLALYPSGFYVAVINRRITGYLVARNVGRKGHIIALAVDENYRNQGVGTRLLEQGLDLFRSLGLDGVWLEVRVSNLPAQRFYTKRNFEALKTIKGYYADGEDALILYAPLLS